MFMFDFGRGNVLFCLVFFSVIFWFIGNIREEISFMLEVDYKNWLFLFVILRIVRLKWDYRCIILLFLRI